MMGHRLPRAVRSGVLGSGVLVANRRCGGERGSASLWLVAFTMVVWVAMAAAVGVGQATIARHRVAAAADLAALAGAQVVATASVEAASVDVGGGSVVGNNGVPGHAPAAGSGVAPTGAALTGLALSGAACARVASVASANGAKVTSCRLSASTIEVVAAISVRGLVGLLGPSLVTATARAGPS